jgi:hypothetical protein
MAANLSGLASPPDAGDPRHAHIQPLLQKGRHAATAAITCAAGAPCAVSGGTARRRAASSAGASGRRLFLGGLEGRMLDAVAGLETQPLRRAAW